MKIEDFEKSKRELEKEHNNKQIAISDERVRVTNANRLEHKFMTTFAFSIISYMLLFIPSAVLTKTLGASVITNILPGFSYPIVMLGGSLAMGTIGRILCKKNTKLRKD